MCSPLGSHAKPFPSICEKMADYIKERQTISNPFPCNRSFPNRPNSSPFANLCKAAPKRQRTAKATPRKIRKNYIQNKGATFGPQPKEKQEQVLFTTAKPAKAVPTLSHMVRAVPNLPVTPNLLVVMATSFSCAVCKACGRLCPMFTKPASPMSPLHSDWSDLDENKDEWDKEGEKNRECEEKDLKR